MVEHRHHQRDVATVIENRRGDGDHGLFPATWVVVGQEADGGQAHPAVALQSGDTSLLDDSYAAAN